MSFKPRAQLGIDGNCGFALLGENLQEGESEFIEIPEPNNYVSELWAAKVAFNKLKARLGDPELSYYFGSSHPYGGG
jgi:hypothetical protein